MSVSRGTRRASSASAPLSAMSFIELYEEIAPYIQLVDDQQPAKMSFFEVLTGMMFAAFADAPVDVAVIEVGMGGRYDATNVILPALSAITPIGYDHTGFLGNKLEGIASEKAGVLKHAMPAVIGRQREVSAQVIAAEAASLAAPLFRLGREWQVTPTAAGFRYESDLLGLDLPPPALAGAHQLDNAATAIACVERLRAAGFSIDDQAVRRGLAEVEWPARLQKLNRGPLAEALPAGCELWLDGGHNEDCGFALARMASDWATEPAPLPLYLVFGMLTSKDASGFLRPLARHAVAARAVPFPEGHSAYSPPEACAKAAEVGLDCTPASDIAAALEDLFATQPAPMRILICGSLYLAGQVLERNG